jgi:gamma-glutamylcyclotransferase
MLRRPCGGGGVKGVLLMVAVSAVALSSAGCLPSKGLTRVDGHDQRTSSEEGTSPGRRADREMRYYFAYGSNMGLDQMKSRCPNHRVFGRGLLRGYRWIISSRGYANIVGSPTDEVYGLVYEISGEDERRLDGYEGVAGGSYRKDHLPVATDRGTIDCLVYVDPVVTEGTPTPEYAGRINDGIRDAGLPRGYVTTYIRKYLREE